jgi:arylsulfatase A-like enzyme
VTSGERPGTGPHGYSTPYEEASHIPLLMRYPPRLKPGVVWRSGVSLVDVMPTILDVCGVESRLDGRFLNLAERSLLPHLEAGRDDRWRGPLVMMNHSPRPLGGALFEDRAIRTERWKLILREFVGPSEGPAGELYDLRADPEETSDLFAAAAQQQVVRDLKAQLKHWGEKHGDELAVRLAS